MAPAKLQHSVLLALGLAAAGCGDKDDDDEGDDTYTGPCLDYPADTGPCLGAGDDTGPCLDVPEDSGSSGGDDTGPCLDVAEVRDADAGPVVPDDAPEAHKDFVHRVLERGVLPDDVAALIRGRRGASVSPSEDPS
jgi:hypothetical protein